MVKTEEEAMKAGKDAGSHKKTLICATEKQKLKNQGGKPRKSLKYRRIKENMLKSRKNGQNRKNKVETDGRAR